MSKENKGHVAKSRGADIRIDNLYVFEKGTICVGSGTVSRLNLKGDVIGELPSILISELDSGHPIGTSLPNDKIGSNITQFVFENIDSLEVFQKALNFCREKLKENEQRKI
jgi:hypothetical protein